MVLHSRTIPGSKRLRDACHTLPNCLTVRYNDLVVLSRSTIAFQLFIQRRRAKMTQHEHKQE